MKVQILCILLVVLVLASNVAADNNDPVVLVHGLAGFAELWMYRSVIEEEGLPTIAVNVGKFTSAWARACETYAQLKGTRVDYGVCHSREFGNQRWGKDYTGQAQFPQWDENHKVHLWGHSLGGPTITTIERILRQGSGCSEDTSPFFAGGNNWITSMTTFSGVLSGTTAIDILHDYELLDFIKDLVLGIAGILDNTLLDQLYDIDFTQWGLEREVGESFEDYWVRVEESGVISAENKDLSVYDLSIEGARSNNAKGPMEYDDTYYFAFATERTHPALDCNIFLWCETVEDPDLQMILFLHLTADWIGQDSTPIERKNDGLVNWINQICPIVDESDRSRCKEWNGYNWPIGEWTYFDVNYLDHLQITLADPINDSLNYFWSAKKIYVDHTRRTKALPSTSSP